MLNIETITYYFISNSYIAETQTELLNSFSLFEEFGLKFYEDKYIELIRKQDSISSSDKIDNFIYLVKKDLHDIIKQHNIVITTDIDVTVREYNEIVHFLYLIQNLESYDEVSYTLFSLRNSRHILVDLIESLTLLSKSRLLEIVQEVNDSLLDSLKEFIVDKLSTQDSDVSTSRDKYIHEFFTFINNHECLGKTLLEQGYRNLTLEELSNIISINIPNHIDALAQTNLAQAALDTLSLLIITKDNYNLPILKFNKSTHIFSTSLNNISRIKESIFSMLNDFNLYSTAAHQQERLDDNKA